MQAALRTVAREAEGRGFNGQIYVEVSGRPVYHAAFGRSDARGQRRTTENTVYQIASITKSVTAVALMKLAEDGVLSPSDRLDRFFKDVPPDKASITLGQLMSHTSGLGQDYPADDLQERDEAVRAILQSKLYSRPGEAFRYTNSGPQLLAAVIETVTGEPYEAYVRRTVLTPADMTRTRFWHEVDASGPDAAAILDPELPNPLLARRWGQIGSGGLWSAAEDLARFHRALRQGRLVSIDSVQAMWAPQRDMPSMTVGYGFFRRKAEPELIWSRGNEGFGHNGVLFWYPGAEILIVVLTNAGSNGDQSWSRAVAERLEEVMFPVGPQQAKAASR